MQRFRRWIALWLLCCVMFVGGEDFADHVLDVLIGDGDEEEWW